MEARKFVVKNQTRDSTLTPSVASVNAALEPLKVLKVLIEGLPTESRTGLWLTNFKGVPVARTLSPFDLVYLDKENLVLHAVALSKDGEFAPFKGRPAGALVLPPGSIVQSHTREGDQLDFQAAVTPEVDPALDRISAPVARETSAHGADPVIREATEVSQPFFSSISASQPEPFAESAMPPLAAREEGGSTVQETLSTDRGPDLVGAEPSSSIRPAPSNAPDSSQDFFTPHSKPVRPIEDSYPPFPPTPETSDQLSVNAASDAAETLPSVQISQPSPSRRGTRPEVESETTSDIPSTTQVGPAPSPYRRRGPAAQQKYSWKVRLLRWLFPHLIIQEAEEPEDRRRADRQSLPGLVAYYFTGGSPAPQRISNISVTGFYLQTDERWMPGTVVRMTLQRLGSKGDDPADTITVNSRIVRWGSDGEGFEFILTDLEE